MEFLHETGDNSKDYKLLMAYDGSGRRISKTRYSKNVQYGYWTQDVVTHYTGIGTVVREAMRRSASPKTTVVVNLPQGLGRYLPEDAEKAAGTAIPLDKDGKPVFMGEATPEFEWYLKNHLGSTMLVYGTQPYNDKYSGYAGGVKAAYDYRAFGEQVDLTEPTDKVTENFTGKEKDDETELNYFGARYLDPMLGLWTSVDAARQFSSPYLYAGNGVNPINGVDDDGKAFNPFGLLVGVGTGVAASWDAQAEYRRVSGVNYNPVTETIVGVVTYGAYVAAGAVGINGGLLKATLLGGLVGGLTSGGSTAFAEILGSEKLEGFDGDKVAEDFTKGFVTTAFGAMMGAGATELLGGAAPAGYVAPSSAEAIGGAVGGAAGFVLDQCTTSEWNKEFAE